MAQLGNTIMESVGQAGVAASEQIKVSAEIWWILVGSGTVFPIHQLDPKYGPLVNPVVDVNGQNPASGGYAEGGRIITTPHTGGSQLDGQQGGTSYTNPEHQLNPGNMYSEADGRNTAQGLIGKDFEDYLHKTLGGQPSFSVKGREFDGKYGEDDSIWYEAKSGRYWEDQTQLGSKGLEKFKSDVGAHSRIAKDSGASFEVHSNTAIPEHVKMWLTSKGIPFREH